MKLQNSLIYNMITLYMRVRAFSMTKDVVQKNKTDKNLKEKIASLRKALKKAEEESSKLLSKLQNHV